MQTIALVTTRTVLIRLYGLQDARFGGIHLDASSLAFVGSLLFCWLTWSSLLKTDYCKLLFIENAYRQVGLERDFGGPLKKRTDEENSSRAP